MFELPNAKRIRRDDIHHRSSSSPSPSPGGSPAPEPAYQDGQARLGKLLNLDLDVTHPTGVSGEAIEQPPETKNEEASADADPDAQEEEFEFRLFGPSAQKSDKPNESSTQKLRIRLRSPTPGPVDPSQGRFVRPFRGWEYYFTTPSLLSPSPTSAAEADSGRDTERRAQFEDVAVTGTEVARLAREQAWPGCHLPWRVIHFKREDTKLAPGVAEAVYVIGRPAEAEPKSRKRPGKKRRVQLRKRAMAAATAAQRAKETDAEKRNRKNRERKIKRRQKAREMKAAAGQVAEHAEADETPEER